MKFVNAHYIEYVPARFLSYDDVLLLPQQSDIPSRNDPSLSLSARLTGQTRISNPLIAANMDTVCGAEMAITMAKLGGAGILHRFYTSYAGWLEDVERVIAEVGRVAFSIGLNPQDLDRIQDVLDRSKQRPIVCVDVANGHTEMMHNHIVTIRNRFGNDIELIGGNTTTPAGTAMLVNAGCDAVKIGVGPGCFAADTKVLMSNGQYKKIVDIRSGDRVINKFGKPVTVKQLIDSGTRKTIKIRTNVWPEWTTVTPDHQFWIGDGSQSVQFRRNISRYLRYTFMNGGEKFRWHEIGNINNERQVLLSPTQFQFELPSSFCVDLSVYVKNGDILTNLIQTSGKTDGSRKVINRYIRSSSDLGYIIGTFLGDGNASAQNTKWSFSAHESDIAERLTHCIRRVFNTEANTKLNTDQNMLLVDISSTPICKFFQEFNIKDHKHLPNKYWINDTDFLSGIFAGLIDSDGDIFDGADRLVNTSSHIINLMEFCCRQLELSFSIRPKKISKSGWDHTPIENCKPQFYAIAHSKSRIVRDYIWVDVLEIQDGQEEQVYDIEVDSEDHSFIANGVIVHNSHCTTREITGAGCPQFSAIAACRRAAYHSQRNIALIADGGIRNSADIAKSIGAGADSVMLGRLFAGTDECPTPIVDGKKLYRGQSSAHFMQDVQKTGVAPEGESSMVDYRGPVENVVKNLLGGLRSSMTYINARSIPEFYDKATFIEVTPATQVENTAYGV